MGTDGLALATLIVIFVSNTFRLLFVKSKFSITPFTNKSFLMLIIIIVFYLLFNFWDFQVDHIYVFKFPVHPIINIALKSILITVLYLFLIIKLKISDDINTLFKRFYK